MNHRLEAFLDSRAQPLTAQGTAITPRLSARTYLRTSTPTGLGPPQPIGGWPTPLRPLIAHHRWYRNVDLLSIAYA